MWINVNMVSYEIILVKVCTSGKRSFQVARFHFSMSGMKILWGVRHGDEGWPVPNEASCFGLEGHVPLLLKLPRCCDFTWLSPQRQISQTSRILCDMIYTVFVIRILLIYSKIIKYICIMESSSNLGIGTNRYLAYRYLQSDSIGVHLFICGETMVQQRNRVLSFPNHPHRCGFTTNVSVDSWSYSFSRLQKWGSLSSVCVCDSPKTKNKIGFDMLSRTFESQVTTWRVARPQRRCSTYIPKLSLVIGRSLDLSIALQYLTFHSQISDSLHWLYKSLFIS